MTRIIPFALLMMSFHFSFSQESKKEACSITPFEVYLEDTDEYSNLRESPKGAITLKINNKQSSGYILTIIGYENGWLKTNNITGVDAYAITDFEGWVHTSIVGAAVTHDVAVFHEPNGTKIVGKLIGEEDTFKIKEVYCEWIKIECRDIVGWIKSSQICGNPVTTCP